MNQPMTPVQVCDNGMIHITCRDQYVRLEPQQSDAGPTLVPQRTHHQMDLNAQSWPTAQGDLVVSKVAKDQYIVEFEGKAMAIPRCDGMVAAAVSPLRHLMAIAVFYELRVYSLAKTGANDGAQSQGAEAISVAPLIYSHRLPQVLMNSIDAVTFTARGDEIVVLGGTVRTVGVNNVTEQTIRLIPPADIA